jgi:hypothetical protein
MYRVLLFAVAWTAVAACGDDNDAPAKPGDDAGIDAPPIAPVRTACVDRPDELSLAPTGQLPCDLLPPGAEIDSDPPRETITATQTLQPSELVEGIMTGGPSDRAVIHLVAPTTSLDWNIHGHANGGTQNVHEELKQTTVDFVYVPSSKTDWWLLLRNGSSTNIEVQIKVKLYGAMTWRWQ